MPELDLAHPLVQMRDVWTFEDLQALDVEDWRRYEIVDGALVVSPAPDLRHAAISTNVRDILVSFAGPGFTVLGADVGVWMDRSYRIPDLMVVAADFAAVNRPYLIPEEVFLAVEIVSPGSATTDRVTKPAQYAAAGIGNFWRVEREPLSLTAYALADGATAYAEVGTWGSGETAQLAEPFPVELEIDRLI